MRARRSRAAKIRRSAGLVLVACLWCGIEADAQTIRGTVLDSESGEPVVLAYVGLLEPGRELVVAGLARRDGTFSLRAPAEGSYFLYVERAGYRGVLDGLFELGEGGVIELSVGMRPEPVSVEGVAVDVEGAAGVEGRRRTAWTDAFDERRARGLGHFLVREEIERRAVEDLTDAMRGIPQLVVVPRDVSFTRPTAVRNPEILVRMGLDRCSPSLYVDGHLMVLGGTRPGLAVRPDDYVDVSMAEGIEVYTSPAEIPIEFETGTGCGVVLIWTR